MDDAEDFRLNVRADFLCRYQALGRAWAVWRRVFVKRRAEAQTLLLAFGHLKFSYCRRAFKSWQAYVAKKREKKKRLLSATVLWKVQAQRRVWGNWQRMLSLKRLCNVQHHIAALLSNRKLTSKALYRWQSVLLSRRRERSKLLTAVDFHAHTLSREAFLAWRALTVANKHFSALSKQQEQRSSVNLLARAWAVWRGALQEATHANVAHQRAETHHRRTALSRATNAWRLYHSYCRLGQARADAAAGFRRQSLKKLLMGYLRRKVLRHTTIEINFALTVARRRRRLLCHAWGVWCARAEGVDAPWLGSLLQIMLVHRRRHLMGSTFGQWRRAVALSHQRTSHMARALIHCNHTRVGRAWEAWQLYVRLMRWLHAMHRTATLFHRRVALRAGWHTWRAATARAVRDYHVMLPLWQAQQRRARLRQAFRVWLAALRTQVLRQWRVLHAHQQRDRTTMANVLTAWRMYAAGQRRAAARQAVADGQQRANLLARAWAQWTRGVWVRHTAQRQWRLAGQFCDALILRRCFAALRTHGLASRALALREVQHRHVWGLAAARRILCAWREALVVRRWWVRHTLSAALTHWRHRLRSARERQDGLAPRCAFVLSARTRMTLSALFTHWRHRARRRVELHARERAVTARALACWRSWVVRRRTLEIAHDRVRRLSAHHSLAAALAVWRLCLHMRMLALCHWSQALRRRCLHRWRAGLARVLHARDPRRSLNQTVAENRVALVRRAVHKWRLAVLRRRLSSGRAPTRPAPPRPDELRVWNTGSAGPGHGVQALADRSREREHRHQPVLATHTGPATRAHASPAPRHQPPPLTLRASAVGVPRLPPADVLHHPSRGVSGPAVPDQEALVDLPAMLAILKHARETQASLAQLRAGLATAPDPARVLAAIRGLEQVDATYRPIVTAIGQRLDRWLAK